MGEIDWGTCQGLIITMKYPFQGMRNTMMRKDRQLKSEIESVKFLFIDRIVPRVSLVTKV